MAAFSGFVPSSAEKAMVFAATGTIESKKRIE